MLATWGNTLRKYLSNFYNRGVMFNKNRMTLWFFQGGLVLGGNHFLIKNIIYPLEGIKG